VDRDGRAGDGASNIAKPEAAQDALSKRWLVRSGDWRWFAVERFFDDAFEVGLERQT
jgi:hypothetical protein